jgi:hypothetical protein
MASDRAPPSPPRSRAGSSAPSTIYFEFQRNVKSSDDEAGEVVPLSTLEYALANWITIAVILFLFVITMVCSLVPVRIAPSSILWFVCETFRRTVYSLSDVRQVLQLPACAFQSLCIGLVSLRWQDDSIFPRSDNIRRRIARCSCHMLVVLAPLGIGCGLVWISGLYFVKTKRHASDWN